MKGRDALKSSVCGRCGAKIRLIPWGLHFKWVSGMGMGATWRCQQDAEHPTRAHWPQEAIT